jgi:putative ABC transport system permease protein
MRRMRALLLRLAAPFTRNRRERDLAAEMESHLQLHIDDNLRAGMTPHEARRQARLALGGQDQVKEACRDARGVVILETLVQDVRYAVRVLRKSRGYSVAAILTLALGIGANTAIFSLVNSFLLRPLPVRDPATLLGVREEGRAGPSFMASFMPSSVLDQIRDRQLFERACAATPVMRANTADRGQADWAEVFSASGNFFDTLGVSAILGRTFGTADDRRGGGPDGPVAVISYAYWQRRFGGSVDVIGRRLTLDRASFTIVGITQPEFFGPTVGRSFDVAVPFAGSSDGATILVRLRRGQSAASATAALRAAQPQIREAALAAMLARGVPAATLAEIGKTFHRGPLSATRAAVGASDQQDRFARPLLAMLSLAALVLLIACANVANLVLGRATARRHEMSVRRALGASRVRLARQVLVESLLLSAVGAALGLLFARNLGEVLVRQASHEANRFSLDLSLDWRVLAFATAATVATALLFGLVPALRAARTQPADALKEGGRGHAGERRWGLNQALIVGQVAFSVVLVVAAGLFVRTFAKLATMDVGFDRERTVIVSLNAQDARVPPANRPAFYERIRQAVAAVPGADGVVTLQSVPASQDHWIADVRVVGETRRSVDPTRGPFLNAVSPGYFSTFGAPILAGRGFDQRDGRGAPLVAIVNETFARLAFGGRSPVGERLTFTNEHDGGAVAPPSSPPFQIVGLAKDSGSAVNYALRQGIPPTVYFSIAQMDPAIANFTPPSAFRIGVRVANASTMREVVAAVTRVEPQLRMIVRPMAGYIDRNLVSERLAAVLSALFGSLALVLAGVGIFGVTAYAVMRRRAEIGIRIALGASPAGVVRTMLQRIVILVGAGIAIGGAVSFWTSRLVAALLFGLEPRDPATFAGAAIVLAAVALLAGWLPARRAARIDPAIVLRNE